MTPFCFYPFHYRVHAHFLYAYKYVLSNPVIQSCYFLFPECQECQWESQVLGVQYGECNIATLNLPHGQDQMVCLNDFAGFKLGNL